MEVRYFKDYKYNYLILRCEETKEESRYQQKMLASNKIERILKCSVRNVNGAAYYYYDISSKVTLENLYQGKKMSYTQVKDFLEQMDFIYSNLTKFFLEESGLLIQPEYIYYDISSKQYYGLYYPQTNHDKEKKIESENLYEPLMDFLLNHIDTENQKLVDNIYQIYELSEEQFFSLADALSLFEDLEEEDYSAEKVIEKVALKEKRIERKGIEIQGKENLFSQENEYPFLQDWKEAEEVELDSSLPDSKKKKEEKGHNEKNRLYYGLFAVLSLCGLGGEFWIYLEYQLTQQEMTMILCCAVVTLLCVVFSLVKCVLSGRRDKKQEKEDEILQREIEDEFRDMHPVSLHGVLDKNMDLAIAGNTRPSQNDYEGDYDETVFFDLKHRPEEYKLYSLDKKNKKHIELTKFPFTIGKMAGCVDCALTDDSISRLHARIEKRENKIFLTDMNSTNGTYKNGLRMEPNETVEIEPGDEIRLGKLNYCYR